MIKNFTTVAVSLFGAVATSVATMPTPGFTKTSLDQQLVAVSSNSQETTTRLVVPEEPKEKRFICKGCNTKESLTLDFLQDKGITDRNALATILGNIKQESTFVPNICEGGARVPYHRCLRGGYGLIQFTAQSRYDGLGDFALRVGGDPSSFDTQLKYIITEPEWKKIEDKLKTPGRPIEYYMRLAHIWLGWGIKGPRQSYAYDYANRLVLVETDS